MPIDTKWLKPLGRDVEYGFLNRTADAPKQLNPTVIVNDESITMLRAIREELRHCDSFSFSVAFVSPRAVALLKQELIDFSGRGTIVTSNYLGFNSPQAFAELFNLREIGIDTRLHKAPAFHPKGYIFEFPTRLTAILGSSNLTESALVRNHEWNLRVSAAKESDLSDQLLQLTDAQTQNSVPLTLQWISEYARTYSPPSARLTAPEALKLATPLANGPVTDLDSSDRDSYLHPFLDTGSGNGQPPHLAYPLSTPEPFIIEMAETDISPLRPNQMQQDALFAIDKMRRDGKRRAIVISATGTGKTILSALDVRAYNPKRMLFVVHREQILDRAIEEFQWVLGAPATDFGKLTGSTKQYDRRYLFATIQTLSQTEVLASLAPDEFDYILIDEVHRAGAPSYHRVLDHFTPEFLLGMTATPERSDGFNVFELFDYNIPYEIRLNRALECDMLAPFHYYGVTDVTFEDGVTTSIETDLALLASQVRVEHILHAISLYGQAGVAPRGLMFCSRTDEARLLSQLLNGAPRFGQHLRTVALTGDDSVEVRERAVRQLESGKLDYILTVDIFNEGVDIPSVNQVIMLRQTQSSIVFVQQLGRGLRKHPGKEYVIVIDFIGNYANNYLIPIALFGDVSLNKESLRKNLIAAEETGVLAGLSSVRFDRIAQQRVLRSIVETNLDSLPRLKSAIEILWNRLGHMPSLYDFLRFESVDPVVLATKDGNYPILIERLFKKSTDLTASELAALTLLSSEALPAKRPHELLLLRTLLSEGTVTRERLREVFMEAGVPASVLHVDSAIRTLSLDFHTEVEQRKYVIGIVNVVEQLVSLSPAFVESHRNSSAFRYAVDDLITTGLQLIAERYIVDRPFTPGRQYSRKDACRLLCWPKNIMSTIYGYRVDYMTSTCPIFITHHKSADISASTAYEDKLLNRSTMRWYTRSRRTLLSKEVAAIVGNEITSYVFAKKDDAEGADFYFLGSARASDAEQTTMRSDEGSSLSVVRMLLNFADPIDRSVYDYFHPVVMN